MTSQAGHWATEAEGPLNVAILFVDLVDSSLFASILPLDEYAAHLRSFRAICERQVRHFFEVVLQAKFKRGPEYDYQQTGDELVVTLHSDKPSNDVYLLTVLAVTLKCAWLAAPHNVERLGRGLSTCELAVGINFGAVWARRMGNGFSLSGYALNLAKRIERHSRQGEHFSVFLSDFAFKQINLKMRNLFIGRRELIQAKGIVGAIGVSELMDSFVNPVSRLEPELAQNFSANMRIALHNTSRDLWIHSCLQVSEEAAHGCVTDENFQLCREVLSVDPSNPVALYYLAQGYRERRAMDEAALLLDELVQLWPHFGDGWLEYGRVLRKMDRLAEAKRAFIRARLHGVSDDEIDDGD